MTTGRERRRSQRQLEVDWEHRAREQPNEPPIPMTERCPARTGAPHNISMRGIDGRYRCWYCAKTRAAIEAATP